MKWLLVFPVYFLCLSCSSLKENPRVESFAEDGVFLDVSVKLAQKRAVDRILHLGQTTDGQSQGSAPPSMDGETIQPTGTGVTTTQSLSTDGQATPADDGRNQRQPTTVDGGLALEPPLPVDGKSERELSTPYRYVFEPRLTHPKVQKWIKYYSEKDRKRFQRFLNRGAGYKQMVQELFVAQGLPPDLYYLGILESGYVKEAVSRSGAVGLWQFMAPTGREYGLKVNHYVDERRDPIRSTLAASRYLKELYRQKKSWTLALAAYNAGPGRVRQAMRRGSSQNYWNLTRRFLLPYDTREYIPQFLAILFIGKNPEHFGFVEKSHKKFPHLVQVKVPSPVKLKRIAKITGLSVKELGEHNPQLLRKITPPGARSYPLWLRSENKYLITKHYKTLARYRLKNLKPGSFVAAHKNGTHQVRRGQNLSIIARRYGLPIKKLKKLNRLKSDRIYVGQRLKLRPGKKKSSGVVSGRRAGGNKKIRRYRVRRGDNLSLISKRFGLTVSQIKKINKLKSDRILSGRTLIVNTVR